MTVYLFAGTNGCGKSTALVDYIELNNLTDIEYVCQGFHRVNIFSAEQIQSSNATDFHLYKIQRLYRERKSMIIEHALADTEILGFLQQAKDVGYRIVSIFISTRSPFINFRRVSKRVSEGGHGVPSLKIFTRYFQALVHLSSLRKVSDELYIYDNSKKLILKEAFINGFMYRGQ